MHRDLKSWPITEKDIGSLRVLADGRVAIRDVWLYDWLLWYEDQVQVIIQDGDNKQEPLLGVVP